MHKLKDRGEKEEENSVGEKAERLLLGFEHLNGMLCGDRTREEDKFDLGDWFDKHTEHCMAQTTEKNSFALMEDLTAFGLDDDAVESIIEQVVNVDSASLGNTLPWTRRDARRLLQRAQ